MGLLKIFHKKYGYRPEKVDIVRRTDYALYASPINIAIKNPGGGNGYYYDNVLSINLNLHNKQL
jgi:hypothetical protein